MIMAFLLTFSMPDPDAFNSNTVNIAGHLSALFDLSQRFKTPIPSELTHYNTTRWQMCHIPNMQILP